MVLIFADLEIHFQRRWLFRPRQRDGMTVDDYYAEFCNWKEEMINVSFPAKEEDYIDGFIENLKWDVRWRSSKYESSRIGLKMAFHNAKFEESMMQLEAHYYTPVAVKQTAESDLIVAEEICVDDARSAVYEKGSELASGNHCNLRSETTDGKHSDEEFEVNELLDCAEMLDFNGIQSNDSIDSEVVSAIEEYEVSASVINSHSSVNSSPQKLLNPMDSGFKVLSIYCAHMASKWNTILEMRPKQSNDMSVEVYYDLFYSWKKKLDAVNYIGGEESYIDDFLYGLEIRLGMRVWGYKWKPQTLYGAFRRAEIEETMMKKDAQRMFDKSAEQNDCEYVLTTMNLHLDRTNCVVNKETTSIITIENPAAGEIQDVKLLESVECSKGEHNNGLVFGNILVQSGVHKEFTEMIGPMLGEDDIWGITATNAAHYMLDERHTRSLVHSAEDLCGKKVSRSSFPYIIGTDCSDNRSNWNSGLITNISKVSIQDLSYRDDVLGVTETNSSSLPKLRFNPQVFDPGTLSLLIIYAQRMPISVNSTTDLHKALVKGVTLRMYVNLGTIVMVDDAQHMFCEMSPVFRTVVMNGQLVNPCTKEIAFPSVTGALENFVDGLNGVDGLLMFIFDPGIGSLHLTGCAPLYSSEMPGSFIVALWLSKVPFYFNPDGCLFNNYCDHSLNRDVPIQVFIGEKVMIVVKMISCWILIYDGWIYSLGLAIISGTCLSCLSPLKADFAWDPGICAISIYILEDKDVFKRVGNRILVMVMIRSIRDGQIKIHVICIEEGFGSMTTWRNGTICASTIFIFPGNLVLDRHSEVPQLLDKTGPPPTGLRPPFTLFSSVEDYYIDSMLRDALDDAPKADKMPINGLGESYSTQNRGLGIDQWLFDEMAESFPIKLKSCVGPNKDLRLSVATLLLQLNIKFWLDVISIFGFYPGTGANEDQWNAYKGHVNMRCIVAVPFGIIDHLVFFLGGCLFRPFDPGGCLFPQIDCDPFESNVPTKGQVSTLAVLVLYMFYLEVIRQRGYIHGTMQSRFSIDPQLIIMQSRCPTNLQLIFGCHLMILHMRIFVNSHYCVCNMLFCIVMISNIKDEVFCQLKIWKSFPILQMSMKVESDKQHLGFWFDDKVPCICQKSTLLLALFPVSCDYYSMLQCHIKMQRPAARSAPKMQGKITTAAILLLFSIIFGISRFMSCALLPYANALAGWLGIYKFNESAAISKMLYGIPVFVFQPP